MSSTTKKFPILAVTCGILVFAVICVCAGVAWHLLQPRETIIDAPDEEGSPTSGLSTTQLALFALVTLVIIGIGVLYHRRIHLPAHRMRRENAQAARDQAARQESFLLQLMENQGQGRPTPN